MATPKSVTKKPAAKPVAGKKPAATRVVSSKSKAKAPVVKKTVKPAEEAPNLATKIGVALLTVLSIFYLATIIARYS